MIRTYKPADAPSVLAVNSQNVPEVGPMDQAKLEFFESEAVLIRVVELMGEVQGFLILLKEDSSYTSPNYEWFCERYQTFAYVDRIALNPAARGQGWGVEFYQAAVAYANAAKKPVLLAEVNTVPPNPRSLHFHKQFGFAELGREQPYGGEEEVAMLAKPIL